MAASFTGIISGRVQGVGFRYFAREKALKLGVQGWVRNLPDGSVEFHVEGEQTPLDNFLKILKKGPPAGHVDRLAGDYLPDREGYRRFEIRP